MVEKTEKMVEDFKNALLQGLTNTDYFSFVKEIVDDYEYFMKICISMGFIKCENELNLLKISKVKCSDGKTYAKLANEILFLQQKFFTEKDYEERRNIIFHELFFSLLETDFSFNNLHVQYFINYLNNNNFKNNDVIYEALEILKICTAQYLSQIVISLAYRKNRKKISSFSSNIFFNNRYFLTNFIIYPEYEQLFLHFLKTLYNIESDDELFENWFNMLQNGEVWYHIANIYSKENEDLLLCFLKRLVQIKKMIELSKNEVLSEHEKYIFTNDLIELDHNLKKQVESKTLKKALVTNKSFNI